MKHALLVLAMIFSSRCRALQCNIKRLNGAGHSAFVRHRRSKSGSSDFFQTTLLATANGPSAVRSLRPEFVDSPLQLLSFYKFTRIEDPEAIRDGLFEKLSNVRGLRGTVYVAPEGVNCAFAVPTGSLEEVMQLFDAEEERGAIPFFDRNSQPNIGNIVDPTTPTFDRLIVRTRDYILRDGIDVSEQFDWTDPGSEIDASDWDEQLREEGVQLLDCRNDYESGEGTFIGARPLNTQVFGDTWGVVDEAVRSRELDPSKPVHIFCTGGIRCVKVGAYLKQKHGAKDVRSLRHGIIGYERWRENDEGTASGKDSIWEGKNFLFDKRRFADNESRGTNREALDEQMKDNT
ncbi:hypothetical protein THAOC_14029 [Thalassiosira oceanica]|uniref:Rhodanese domain-containing protein n=1 Tax=Thalassiosira oceanica TaxID=159749 RepID=K0T487_THAOC|nr:hypothetical protein THAOC_14029 [Thalassiosira oceanica]|eukprot:EJK65152.1 hypothetical protein THAOC_14029 [Thalassiosira oceanica]